jgi:hypothetical protein
MPRYRFTSKDLQGLAPLLEHPVVKEGLKHVRPVKHFAPARRVNKLQSLPVRVRSRDAPDGVPLDKILKAVQAEVAGVTSIVVKLGRVVVKRTGPRDEAADLKIRQFLMDKKKLELLKSPRSPVEDAVESGRRVDLERALVESETSDSDWLVAFRAYAVKHLIKHK